MAFTREQIRDSIERAGDEHWQALIQHHTDAYPESNPTPGDVARAEAARLNDLGLTVRKMSQAEFADFVQQQVQGWAEPVKASGAKLN